MGQKSSFAIQSFIRVEGALVAGPRIQARSRDDALATARALVPTIPGAAALQITSDVETGEHAGARIISQSGELPDRFDL